MHILVLEADKAADMLVLRADSLELKDVFAGRRRLVKDGRLALAEKFLEGSTRRIRLDGAKTRKSDS